MRVLVLTHRLPYAPNRGDRLRVYHILRHLTAHADVELVSLVHDDDEAAHVDDVRRFVPRVSALRVPRWRTRARALAALPTRMPLTHALLDSPGAMGAFQEICARRRPDVVFAYCSGMARFALQPPLDTIPLVLDFVDVDSVKWRDLARTTRGPRAWIYWREAAALGAFESVAAARAVASLVVNEREAANARALSPTASVEVVANGVDIDRLRPNGPPTSRPRVVFCGVMDYAPNEEGMTWFVRQVWPLVRAARPDAALSVVGAGVTPAFLQLCRDDDSIAVTGRVPDVRDWLWESAVAIAPLHVARGVQNKALEAIASGLPVVMTPAVAGGLPVEAAPASRVADGPRHFAESVLSLLSLSGGERRAIASRADLTPLQWSRTLEPLWAILQKAVHAHPPSVVAKM